jgi:hypothetical protein
VCGKPFVGSPACVFLESTGPSGQEKLAGIGIPMVGTLTSAANVDVYAVDLAVGKHAIALTPTDVGTQLDLAYDVYDQTGALDFTINHAGPGQPETDSGVMAGVAARYFILVRSVNAINGNYQLVVQ